MSQQSDIQWTDATWNPVTGCDKVSPGCANCYAEGVAKRFWATQYPLVPHDLRGELEMRPRTFIDVVCHEDRLEQPLHWKRPRKIFVNSMSDLFHEDVPDAFIDQVFAVMALAPRHTFQLLTKRAERMRAYFGAGQYRDVKVADSAKAIHTTVRPFALPSEAVFDARRVAFNQPWQINAWPLPNVWLGVSVENQHFADERIPLLLDTPAAVRFVSAEPLLGPVNLAAVLFGECADCGCALAACKGLRGTHRACCPDCRHRRIDWVIVGGESGRGARVFDLVWARFIVNQCAGAGVPVFVKQLGANPIRLDGDHEPFWSPKGDDPAEWPEDLRVRQFPAQPTSSLSSSTPKSRRP